jgi:ERCC4-type nuclease
MPDITIRGEASLDIFANGLIKNGFEVERKQIPIDIIIWTEDKPIMAERKTCSDLARSIRDASIWEQLKAMEVTDRKNRHVLLEDYNWRGFFELAKCPSCSRKTYKKLCPKCGNKTVPIVQMNRHSIVSTTSDINKFANLVVTLTPTHTYEWIQDQLEEVLRSYKEKKYYKLRPSAKRDFSLGEQAQYIVEGFPGVGGVASQKIRQNSDSLFNFIETINYKTDSINYIPKKLVEKIKDVCMTGWRK